MKRLTSVLWLGATLLLPTSAWAVGPGAVTGQVEPTGIAPEVEVCVVEASPSETCAEPAADGSYELTGIPLGVSRIEFLPSYRSHYLPQYWDHKASAAEAATIELSQDFPKRESIDADLVLGGQIEGEVSAASTGSPLADVEVCVFPARSLTRGACDQSDSSGHYALPTVPPGTYRVGFFGRGASAGFVSQFYSGVPGFSDATPVGIGAGTTVLGIDAEMQPGGSIAGDVAAAANGARLPGISVCLFRGAEPRPEQCVFTDASGGYSFLGLATGAYQVGFSLSSAEVAAEGVEGSEEDGYLSQYFAAAATRSAATAVGVIAPATVAGVDARLMTPASPLTPAPLTSTVQIVPPPPSVAPPAEAKRKTKCKRGFRSKKVKGRVRCVKAGRSKHQRRRKHRHKRPGRQEPDHHAR